MSTPVDTICALVYVKKKLQKISIYHQLVAQGQLADHRGRGVGCLGRLLQQRQALIGPALFGQAVGQPEQRQVGRKDEAIQLLRKTRVLEVPWKIWQQIFERKNSSVPWSRCAAS